jgi:hypothetical protein
VGISAVAEARVIGVLPVLALVALAWQGPPPGDSHLLIVTGLGGEDKYREAFYQLGAAMVDAATNRFGLADSNIVFLGEKVERDSERIDGRSTKENVERALVALAERAGPRDRVFILLIGHGSSTGSGEEARFNLPGPDVTAGDFLTLLGRLPTQQVILANTASASGDFVKVLSGPNRTIVTATKTGFERNETIFGKFFVEAFTGDGADVDKNERISVLEAFNYARLQVARTYEEEDKLLTEHAMLDDNGDGEGSGEPDPQSSDGARAQQLFLSAGVTAGVRAVVTDDPVLVALYGERQRIEEQIEALKLRKEQMPPEEYETRLEDLLVELALKSQEIREREKGSG